MRTHRSTSTMLLIGACLALTPSAFAEPRGKLRPKPATQADVERVERKVDAQQQVIDKMIRLQQQYLQAVTALAEGGAAPAAAIEKPTEKPLDRPAEKPAADVTATRPATRPEPRIVVKAKPQGAGTVVGKVTGAADAVLYIEDIVASGRGTAEMKQEGKQFLPKVLVVQKGTKVEFPNRDAIFHNVFSVSPDNTFDLGSYRQGESKGVTMSRAGVVTVYCNMHPQMVGHILVVPNGNFVRAGKDGFFRLPNVPAGSHRVVAWAPNAKPVSVQTTVADGEVVTIEVALSKTGSTAHTKKDGLPYGSYEQ